MCVCIQITPEPINRSLLKNLWVGPDCRKKLLKERSQCIFIDFSLLLDVSMKINLHVQFYFIVFLTILYIT